MCDGPNRFVLGFGRRPRANTDVPSMHHSDKVINLMIVVLDGRTMNRWYLNNLDVTTHLSLVFYSTIPYYLLEKMESLHKTACRKVRAVP